MTSKTYTNLYRLIETLPVISSHEHHLPDDFHVGLTLDRIFENSYLTMIAGHLDNDTAPAHDYLVPVRKLVRSYHFPGQDVAHRDDFLAHCRHNSYYVWLEKALQIIYGFDDKITSQNWDNLSEKIKAKHASDGAHIDILREVAGYRRAVLDPYWDYGTDNKHPEMFVPTMRTDMFVTSFHPETPDHDGNSPFDHYPNIPTENFDDYLDFLEDMFTGWRNAGAVAMKSASAYDRSLQYDESNRVSAAKVFYQHPGAVGPSERKVYEDFMFNWFCRLCIRFEVPFQVHTGLGKLVGSRPLLFEPVIARYPQIHFVLFHAGYPWYGELAGLAHNHHNISLDMVWAPIVSTTGAVLALHQFLEVAHSSDLIAWGGDAWTSEEAFGALLAWRHVVARVLAEKIDDGYLDMNDAETLAHKLLYRNAATLYDLEIP